MAEFVVYARLAAENVLGVVELNCCCLDKRLFLHVNSSVFVPHNTACLLLDSFNEYYCFYNWFYQIVSQIFLVYLKLVYSLGNNISELNTLEAFIRNFKLVYRLLKCSFALFLRLRNSSQESSLNYSYSFMKNYLLICHENLLFQDFLFNFSVEVEH